MHVLNPFRAVRRTVLLSVVASMAVAVPAEARFSSPFPDSIELPNGWRPEGVVVGRGSNVYVGSLANGAIWHGDLRTGEGDILFPGGTGQVTVGLEYDQHDRIWAAGGPTGVGKVFDAKTGSLLETYTLATPGTGFINDVVVTADAAYFTNTAGGQLFPVPLGPGGRLPDSGTIDPLAIDAASPNGIETTPDNKALIVVSAGALFRVDPATETTTEIDLGGENVVNGDGLVRNGTTLYVVQNRVNMIAVVKLNAAGTAGTVERRLTDPDLDVPATADLFGSAVYAVNARFTTPPTPSTSYTIERVER
jgi:sugar lactone lactonase YvrE